LQKPEILYFSVKNDITENNIIGKIGILNLDAPIGPVAKANIKTKEKLKNTSILFL